MTVNNIESLINQLGGCGRFQVLMSLACYLAEVPVPWIFLMMAFGRYNPGMECPVISVNNSLANSSELHMSYHQGQEHDLDGQGVSSTVARSNYINVTVSPAEDNVTWTPVTCDMIEQCGGNVRFDDSASTVVTEWNLVCDRAWIASLIILVQMIGAIIGGLTGGFLANKFGRKVAIYLGLALCGVLNLVLAFSISWYMFAVLRFILGWTVGSTVMIPFYFQGEFMPVWWRGILGSIPDWCLATITFGLVTFALQDWRHVLIATAVVCFLCCLPALWIPESMRWLVIHDRLDQADKVARKIARINRTSPVHTEVFMALKQLKREKEDKNQVQQFVNFFRRDMVKRSVGLGTAWFMFSAVAYGLNFGVESLAGNFYVNFIIMNLVPIPAHFVTQFTVNCLGRRWTCLGCIVLAASSTALIVILQLAVSAERAGMPTTILAVACNGFLESGWVCSQAWLVELFPTTLRSLAFSWALSTTRTGGIISPFIIQKDVLSLVSSFSIVTALLLVSLICLWILPETKGKPLNDVIAEDRYVTKPMMSEICGRKSLTPSRP